MFPAREQDFFMAGAAFAEVLPGIEQPDGPRGPHAIRVDQLEQDKLIRADAARFIGRALASKEIVVEPVDEDSMSLLGAVKEAANGNGSALPNINKNASIATIEGIYKSGHITDIVSEIKPDGSIVQFGQSHTAVYTNALKYTSKFEPILNRTKAETVNGTRIGHYARTDELDDCYLLVSSLCPDDIPRDQLEDHSFFGATMTGVLQATTVKDGKLVTQSAFVAGVTEKDGPRHDIETVKKIYEFFGQSSEGLSVTELLERPLLVPKKYMPNGVLDIVKLYDELAGGLFFGSNQEVQDYDQYLEVCRQREKDLKETVGKIVQEIVASADELHKPIDAIEKLYELTKKHALAYVVTDDRIDTRIFGEEAHVELQQARVHYKNGDEAAMQVALEQATDKAIFTMCGAGTEKKEAKLGNAPDLQTAKLSEANQLENSENDTSGRIRCFRCHEYVDKKDVVDKETKNWCCPKCNYEVDACTGEVICEGNIKAEDNNEEATIYHAEEMFRQKQLENDGHE